MGAVGHLNSIVFTVDAQNDALVALMSGCASHDCPKWEIVIGGWANTQSVLRTENLMTPLATSAGAPLAPGVARTFWVAWSGLSVRVGTGPTVGTGQFMAATRTAADPGGAAFSVTQLSVSTGWGASGVWLFSYTPAPATECTPCAAGSYSAAGATSCAYTASTCPVGTFASAPASCAACSPATACAVPGLASQPPCYWNVSTLAGSGEAGSADGQGAAAKFTWPVGISVDPVSLNVYVGDYLSHRIRRISPSGLVSTFAGSGTAAFADGVGTSALFNGPHNVRMDSTGNLYVGDYLGWAPRPLFVSLAGSPSMLAILLYMLRKTPGTVFALLT